METAPYEGYIKENFKKIVERYNNHNYYYWNNEKKISEIHNKSPISKVSTQINIGSRQSAFKKYKIN